jgi:predicted butyrate kinase (DUF1464 family)
LGYVLEGFFLVISFHFFSYISIRLGVQRFSYFFANFRFTKSAKSVISVMAYNNEHFLRAKIMSNIQEQIRLVEEKIRDYKIKLMVEEGVLKRLRALDNSEQPLLPLEDNEVQTAEPVAQEGSLVEHIRTVLSENNRSMHVKEICSSLKAKGVTTGAKAGLASAIACAMYRRDDLFQRLRRGLYRLRNQKANI